MVQVADAATLDTIQGADYIQYRIHFDFGPVYYNDPRSRYLSNWKYDPNSAFRYNSRYSGRLYVSQISQVIFNDTNNPNWGNWVWYN